MSIKQAGKELLKANFGTALTQLLSPSSYRGDSPAPARIVPDEIMAFGGDGVGAFYSFSGIGSCLSAYEQCPPLQAVCNKRALNFVKGRITILNSVGKPSTSSQSKRVMKLLNNPNPLQTRSAFLAQIHTYIDLVGYAVVLPVKPVGFEMHEAESFWVIPPVMSKLITNGSQLNIKTGGIDAVQIGNVWLDPADVMILTDINPSVRDMIKPGEKIRSLETVINNIIGAYQSESTLIYHRGPSTIISSEPTPGLGVMPIAETEKENMMSSAMKYYGFTKGQTHLFITNAAVKVDRVGFNAEELKLWDTIKNGTVAICDTIGWPTELMGITNPIYNNKKEAGKEAYTKFTMPMADNIAEQLASYLLPVTDSIQISYNHVDELQQDKTQAATARKTLSESLKIEFDLNLITQNQMLEALGFESIGPQGDLRKSEIPPGNVPLAVTLGVGGVQALTALLADQGLSEEARQAALEVVFGLSADDARRMSSAARSLQSTTNTPSA
jgi:Phage portal protein